VLGVFLVAGFFLPGDGRRGSGGRGNHQPEQRTSLRRSEPFSGASCCSTSAPSSWWDTLISYTDPNLLHGDESHIAFSPFTMVFQMLPRFGYYAANLMNAVILSSVLSCGNSSIVRGLANVVRDVPQPQGPETLRHTQPARRARGGASGQPARSARWPSSPPWWATRRSTRFSTMPRASAGS